MKKGIKKWISVIAIMACTSMIMVGCGSSSYSSSTSESVAYSGESSSRQSAKLKNSSSGSSYKNSSDEDAGSDIYDVLSESDGVVGASSLNPLGSSGGTSFVDSIESYMESDDYDSPSEVDSREDTVLDPELDGGDETGGREAEFTLVEEKLVYRGVLGIETTEYEETMAAIEELIDEYNGVIQYRYETDSAYHWYYEDYSKTSGTLETNLSIRVPSQNYKAFMSGVGDSTSWKITSKEESVDNISQEYYDTQTEIDMLEIEQDNLLQMMDAATTIEDMITIESRLSDVRTELAQLNSDIRYMDMDVAYSYVDMVIEEVMEYTKDEDPRLENTFFDRLHNQLKDTGEGFLNFLEWLLFFIIAIAPYAVIIVILVLVYRSWRKKHPKKKNKESLRGMMGELRNTEMGQYNRGYTMGNPSQPHGYTMNPIQEGVPVSHYERPEVKVEAPDTDNNEQLTNPVDEAVNSAVEPTQEIDNAQDKEEKAPEEDKATEKDNTKLS